MKQLLKAILPKPVLKTAVDVKDRVNLVSVSKEGFDLSNLRSVSDISLKGMFSDEDTLKVWDKVHPVITDIYGSEDQYGGVNPGDRRALFFLLMGLKPKNVLEVGTHIGASTLHIACALKALGQGGHVTTADIIDVNHPQDGPWKQVGMAKSPHDFAKALECEDYITFREGPCQDFMKTTDQRFDFIFLDGDHRAKAVYQEVSAALPLLNEGGVILLHDYYPGAKALYPDKETIGGPYHAMQRVQRENPNIQALPLGELPWPTKQGTNITTLALVVRR